MLCIDGRNKHANNWKPVFTWIRPIRSFVHFSCTILRQIYWDQSVFVTIGAICVPIGRNIVRFHWIGSDESIRRHMVVNKRKCIHQIHPSSMLNHQWTDLFCCGQQTNGTAAKLLNIVLIWRWTNVIDYFTPLHFFIWILLFRGKLWVVKSLESGDEVQIMPFRCVRTHFLLQWIRLIKSICLDQSTMLMFMFIHRSLYRHFFLWQLLANLGLHHRRPCDIWIIMPW